ncbi:MAG TPA: transcriptional repressor [Polyangiaceae bacterium LLY-WYZ-15_(1-7)]|nr:transcriptional repressor [Myxococcales bacterium]MAT24309.1 transcriptional repressor [Sandaracinus sp.]HJK90360.1 transcriptional repressor [Polyangiaceae bacterium LLY-WYZ-15_(1-7)]MBJ72806.1 transcriptional repressor [Sandaracinus sp.]HJL04279.1 transcriptional repressor [Polyangiaceae bacterium LLY-WYZ-15_(1-7)]
MGVTSTVEENAESVDEEVLEELNEKLSVYMDKNGLRSTSQRRVVTDVFFRSTGHLSIEELLAMVRERDPKIGYATVYRTLKLLKDCGIAYERHFGDGVSRYEIALEDEHHDHLICLECGKIVEFENDEIERLQDELAKKHDFTLKRHTHELYGVCGRCRGKKN